MDPCFVDITVEFLSVAFHNILYYVSIYPASIFETRKKYNVVVYRSTHPEVNEYINLCLKSVAECLNNNQLTRIEFAVTNGQYEPMLKFIFDVNKNETFVDTTDAYLIQTEENLRAFCLRLASMSSKFTSAPNDCSFIIRLHTNESTAVAMSSNPDFEGFPLVVVDDKSEETNKILPIRRLTIKNYILDTYVEIK